MKQLLITGSQGRIGQQLAPLLQAAGYTLRGFDTTPRNPLFADQRVGDLRELSAVRAAMQGIDAVVHLGAIPSDFADGEAVMQTNVMGTWNVLQAALEQGVRRAVVFSSINAQGSVKGFWPVLQLPIDDDYPHHPMTPYQLSKHLGEEICRSFSERHGMVTLCLRPAWVTHNDHYVHPNFGTARAVEIWRHEYWAYVDVHDVCDAVVRCLQVEGILHDCFLLAAADTLAHLPTSELVQRYHPEVPWPHIPPETYLAGHPFRSLVDCTRARERLGWQPTRRWREASALAF